MTEVEDHINDWISKISEIRPELRNFAVCPFSSAATYNIIECPIDDIMPLKGFDVVIFVVESYLDANAIQMWCEIYNTIYQEYIFLEDCGNYHTFINGIQTSNGKYNLLLCQSKQKLKQSRKILAESGYYEHWNDSMLREILGEDYEIVKNRDSNPTKSSNQPFYENTDGKQP